MNTGQMLLVAGAFALLATLSLSITRTLADSDEVQLETQAGTVAVAVCRERLVDRVSTPFDSLLVGVWSDTVATSMSTMVCSTRVDYSLASDPDSVVVGPTDLKRVSISVRDHYMPGWITLHAIAANY